VPNHLLMQTVVTVYTQPEASKAPGQA
jgi:hypothetical protein